MYKIKDLLTDESKWTKEVAARLADGTTTYPQNKDAVRFCLVGAVERCYGDRFQEITDKIAQYINGPLIPFNDAPETTFSDVRALIEKLDI